MIYIIGFIAVIVVVGIWLWKTMEEITKDL